MDLTSTQSWLREAENTSTNIFDSIEPQPPSTLRSSKGTHGKTISSPRTYVPSRPLLLRHIEEYLQEHLSQLTVDDQTYTEDWLANKKLQIYREAFQLYLNDSNIYKPFLLAVKHEYEVLLDFFSGRARNQLKVKTDVASRQREFVQQLKQKDEDHREEVRRLKNELAFLQKQLISKDSLITAHQTQINILKGSMGKSDHEIVEARQSCVTLTNALTRLDEEKKRLIARDNQKQSEIMALKVALSKTNNDLDRLRLQLHDLEAEQSNLVSSDILEKHLAKLQDLQDTMKQRDEQMKTLIQRYSLLKNAIETAFAPLGTKIGRGADFVNMTKLDWNDKEIARDVEKILRNDAADPRMIVEALIDKVRDLSIERDEESNKALRLAEGMLEDGNDGILEIDENESESFHSPWTHFEGLGLGPEIPVYLRTTGKIQNLRYSKKDTELYLNEIWIAKEQYEAHLQREKAKISKSEYLDEPTISNGGKIHLREYFLLFLDEKFKTQTRALEFSYNFFDSLKKYDFDSDCKIFLMIMNGELAEEVRHDQLMLINTLLEEFQREEFSYRQSEDGRLPVDSFMRVIKRIIPTKGEHALRRLQKALDLEIKGRKYVQYREIMEEDEQGNQGKFCETLRNQHLTECLTYSNHVMEIIDQFAIKEEVEESGDSLPSSPLRSPTALSSPQFFDDSIERAMTLSRLRDALVFADPDNQRAAINKLLARACGVGTEEMLALETKKQKFTLEFLKKNLKQGLLKKSYPSGGGSAGGGGAEGRKNV